MATRDLVLLGVPPPKSSSSPLGAEPANSCDRVLCLENAYQGRAMFVKVSCKAGGTPVELSHHPELRFRFIPREGGRPLIANAVQFEAGDEVELLMRRDRAGCWISMDEVLIFERCAFEIWCEKEKWAHGRVRQCEALGSGSFNSENGKSKAAWSLELSSVQPSFMDRTNVTSEVTHDTSVHAPWVTNAAPALGLELCLVGACAGTHLAMTKECALQAWKVASPRSFVMQPSMCAISEEMSGTETWSEDSSGDDGGEPLFETPRGDARDAPFSKQTDFSKQTLQEEATNTVELEKHVIEAPENDGVKNGVNSVHSVLRAAPWSIVPWRGDKKPNGVAFDRAEVLRNVRKRYEDLMREYDDSGGLSRSGELRNASDELFTGELTWFSAGMRIGVGLGLGVCLGLGLGVGILVNGYRSGKDRLSDVRQAFRLR